MRSSILALLLAAAPMPAMAQHNHGSMAAPPANASASTKAYEASAARMHEGMAITYTGDADIDFAQGMIPHHQGAVDMARILLQLGKDPELRLFAEGVIKAQEAEILQLQAILQRLRK